MSHINIFKNIIMHIFKTLFRYKQIKIYFCLNKFKNDWLEDNLITHIKIKVRKKLSPFRINCILTSSLSQIKLNLFANIFNFVDICNLSAKNIIYILWLISDYLSYIH